MYRDELWTLLTRVRLRRCNCTNEKTSSLFWVILILLFVCPFRFLALFGVSFAPGLFLLSLQSIWLLVLDWDENWEKYCYNFTLLHFFLEQVQLSPSIFYNLHYSFITILLWRIFLCNILLIIPLIIINNTNISCEVKESLESITNWYSLKILFGVL